MSCFSFTAPIVTPEEEVIERAAIEEDEWKRIRAEVYGTEQILPETKDMLSSGVALVRQALLQMPENDKRAYSQALEQIPDLVEQESNPLAFLRGQKYNAWAAAKQLAFYWEMRLKIFGPELAFLPMSQAGAMRQDLEYLKMALVTVLPDDKHGRPVFYWDKIASASDVAPRESVLRCIFYIQHSMCEREAAQRQGFVIVVNFRGYNLYRHFDRMMAKKSLLVFQCMPAKVKALHPCTGPGRSVMEFVLPLMKQLAGLDYRLRNHLHSGSDREIVERIEDFGLGEEHVRTFFGRAEQNAAEHTDWLLERKALEESRLLQPTAVKEVKMKQ